MQTPFRRVTRVLALPLATTLLSLASLAQSPAYVGKVVAPSGQPQSVNAHGQVVGSLPGGGAFVATGGVHEILPLPDGMTGSQAFDINDFGVIVGAVSDFGPHAARWTPTPTGYDVEILTALPGHQHSQANAINNLGDVIGFTFVSGFSGGPATLFVDSTAPGAAPVDLSALGFSVTPRDINDSRQAVGGSKRIDLDTLVVEELGVPTGGSLNYLWTTAYAINEAGQVASTAVIATSGNNPYAVARYTDGVGWLVLSPGGAFNTALDIDGQGQVLFQMGVGAGNELAIYTDGIGTRFLDSILPTGWGTTASWAGGMNELGQLTAPGGSGSETGIMLATPVSGTVATSGCGANPAGSLSWSGGTPQTGATFEVSVHNPLASQSPGSLALLVYSASPPKPFPCGLTLPGFGMTPGSDGALLVDIASPTFGIFGSEPWTGVPVLVALPIPAAAVFGGIQLFLQGALIDASPGAAVPVALTEGLTMSIGI